MRPNTRHSGGYHVSKFLVGSPSVFRMMSHSTGCPLTAVPLLAAPPLLMLSKFKHESDSNTSTRALTSCATLELNARDDILRCSSLYTPSATLTSPTRRTRDAPATGTATGCCCGCCTGRHHVTVTSRGYCWCWCWCVGVDVGVVDVWVWGRWGCWSREGNGAGWSGTPCVCVGVGTAKSSACDSEGFWVCGCGRTLIDELELASDNAGACPSPSRCSPSAAMVLTVSSAPPG
mmetsp:Transcript_17977/g.43216  ORF Transcript_17977/g.43216 Transcript_17977/m.43216 type:complete len:233 (-) Transcript_17977:1050-1748(-)